MHPYAFTMWVRLDLLIDIIGSRSGTLSDGSEAMDVETRRLVLGSIWSPWWWMRA